MSLLAAYFRAEADWKERRDGFALTFLTVATPLSLVAAIPERCLPWMKASIFLCSLGILLSILGKRWRSPGGTSEEQESRRGRLARLLGRAHFAAWHIVFAKGSWAASLLLVAALVCLLVAVALR